MFSIRCFLHGEPYIHEEVALGSTSYVFALHTLVISSGCGFMSLTGMHLHVDSPTL